MSSTDVDSFLYPDNRLRLKQLSKLQSTICFDPAAGLYDILFGVLFAFSVTLFIISTVNRGLVVLVSLHCPQLFLSDVFALLLVILVDVISFSVLALFLGREAISSSSRSVISTSDAEMSFLIAFNL